MSFEKVVPDWQAKGIEPPQSKRETGWEVEDRPPAAWLNWFMNLTAESLLELQTKAVEKSYVDDQISEAIKDIDVDIPEASLTQKGIAMLSNATNGTRETVAATEKAVGLAFQAGNERKAEVVAVLVSKGIAATTSETWDSLLAKMTALIKATGNAILADVLAGKTFSNAAGNSLVGTMANYSAGYTNPQTGTDIVSVASNDVVGRMDISVPAGYHRQINAHILGLTLGNIRNGAKIGHPTDASKQLVGNYGWDGTVTSAQILNGYIGYNASGRVVGAMPVASDPTTHWLSDTASYGPYSSGDPTSYIYLDTNGMIGKYNHNISWARFPVGDILPENFRAGKTAFGGQLVGTMVEGLKYFEVTMGVPIYGSPVPINVGFAPRMIEIAIFYGASTIPNAHAVYYNANGGSVGRTPFADGRVYYELDSHPLNGGYAVSNSPLPQIFNLVCNTPGTGDNRLVLKAYE